MTMPNHHIQNAGDLVASFSAFLVIVSHWSEVLTPIVALIVGVLTAIWWCIRLRDRLVNGVGKS